MYLHNHLTQIQWTSVRSWNCLRDIWDTKWRKQRSFYSGTYVLAGRETINKAYNILKISAIERVIRKGELFGDQIMKGSVDPHRASGFFSVKWEAIEKDYVHARLDLN